MNNKFLQSPNGFSFEMQEKEEKMNKDFETLVGRFKK